MSRCLIEIIAYEFTTEQILNYEFIPEFYIFNDRIYEVDSEIGLDHIPRDEEHLHDKIVMFDISPLSNLAVREFCESGVYNFIVDNIENGLVDIIKNQCPVCSILDCWSGIGSMIDEPKQTFVVIDIDFTKSYDYYSGCYEYDMDVDVVGYLNSNMELVLWK